jgi:hypothetical protein
MSSGFLAYGCPSSAGIFIAPGIGWSGVAGTGNTQPPALDTSVQGSGWAYSAVGAYDECNGIWIENTTTQVCVGAATQDRAGIKQVNVYCESSTPTVLTTQTISNRGSQGYVFTPISRSGQNGEATYTIDIIPYNGLIQRLTATWVLNTDVGTLISRAARYVDYSTGNDNTGDGLSAGTAWKTFNKATQNVPSGGIIYYAGNLSHGGGAVYLEETTTGNAQTVARPVDIRPLIAGDTATVSRTASKQTFNGASNGGSAVNNWRIMCSKLGMEGLTIDLAKLTGLGGGSTAITYLVHKRCAFVDPNGVLGPLYSWNPNESIEGYAGSCVDCTFSAPMALSASFIRNCSGYFSWDSMFMFSPGGYTVFNYSAYAPVGYQQRGSDATILTVSTITYNGNNTSTIVWVGSPLLANLTQAGINLITNTTYPARTITNVANNGSGLIRLTMASTTGLATGNVVIVRSVVGNETVLGGNEANDTWIITVVDGTHVDLQGSTFLHTYVSGGVMMNQFGVTSTSVAGFSTTFGDAGGTVAALISPGNTAWISTPGHSDVAQFALGDYANNYFQRYKCTGKSVQLVLLQATHSTLSGTISTTGTSVTFSSAQSFSQDQFIVLSSGPQAGQARRVVAATVSSTSATLVSAFTVDQSGVSGFQTKTVKNTAFVNCIFDHFGVGPEIGQVQDGTLNVFYLQSTLHGASVAFRTDFAYTAVEAFGAIDCVFNNLGTSGGGGFPASVNIDGDYFESGTLRGTNAGGTGIITYNSTDGTSGPNASYTPTSGLTQTVRGLNGTGVPLVPFNYYNAVKGVGALVGAV